MPSINMIKMYASVFMSRTVLCSLETYAHTNYANERILEEHCVDVIIQPRLQLSQQTIMTDASGCPTGQKRDNRALDKFT